ncbi:MAG: hypothetical protein ABW051_10520, partial [Burkholderiaceae bacterium]
AHVEPTAPPAAADAATWLRDMRDLPNGFSYRLIESLGTTGGAIKDVRVTYEGENVVPFARNRSYLMGGAWVDAETLCPANGTGFGTWQANPRQSSVCGGAIVESQTSFDADITGKTFEAVVADARSYSSRDGSLDFTNWGPTVLAGDDEYTDFTQGKFPVGSRLRYQSSTLLETADALESQSRIVRNLGGGATSTVADLALLVSSHGGGFDATPVNGVTTAAVLAYRPVGVMTAAGTTGRKLVRVSFKSSSATAGAAKFLLCDEMSAGGIGNCGTNLDTTYTIAANDGKNVLRFAAVAPVMAANAGFQRLYIEHNGLVHNGSRGVVGGKSYTLRLNQTAWQALLGGVFGETPPSQTLVAE